MTVRASLQHGDYFAVDLRFASCGRCESGFADVALHNVCRVAEDNLFVAAVGTAHSEETGLGFGKQGLPVRTHYSLPPMTSFLKRIPFFWMVKPQLLHFSFNVCFLVVFANFFCNGHP